ncbi:hypothetical protein MCRY_21140 [Marivita cryptomonadis]|jgi:hypothetical protein|uniref:hypothetical protein n=1 Tax=Marivita cryptomonadis TaxID=505252 RepID=UPI000A1F0F60|nr:hypothetical protein [Marivita cryptomonadis]OSQ54466.1 hypothetical protein MCRY_21140 [Marivita cryptomonadis]
MVSKVLKDVLRSLEEGFADHSVFLSMHGVKTQDYSLQLTDYAERGIFSSQQKNDLAERHDLPNELVEELSILVGNALDTDSEVPRVRISRSKVINRIQGWATGERLRTRPILMSPGEINAIFDALALPFFVAALEEPAKPSADSPQADANGDAGQFSRSVKSAPSTNRFAQGKLQISSEDEDESAARVAISDLDDQPTLASEERFALPFEAARHILVADNLGALSDARRLLVVEQVCYIATDAGWSLTYTSRDEGGRWSDVSNRDVGKSTVRTGRLIKLLQDVMQIVTGHAQTYSGHTAKSDIESVRARIARRLKDDSLKAP